MGLLPYDCSLDCCPKMVFQKTMVPAAFLISTQLNTPVESVVAQAYSRLLLSSTELQLSYVYDASWEMRTRSLEKHRLGENGSTEINAQMVQKRISLIPTINQPSFCGISARKMKFAHLPRWELCHCLSSLDHQMCCVSQCLGFYPHFQKLSFNGREILCIRRGLLEMEEFVP